MASFSEQLNQIGETFRGRVEPAGFHSSVYMESGNNIFPTVFIGHNLLKVTVKVSCNILCAIEKHFTLLNSELPDT
jgi:hypothetical protein